MRCRQSDDWNQLVHTLAADSTQLMHDDGLRKCCCQSYDVQPSGGGSWSHRSREQRRMSQRQLGWMPQGDISATSRFSDTPRQPHTHPRRHGSSTANSAGQIYTRIGGEGTMREQQEARRWVAVSSNTLRPWFELSSPCAKTRCDRCSLALPVGDFKSGE